MQCGSNRSRTSVKCEYKMNFKKTKLKQLIKRYKFSNTKKILQEFRKLRKAKLHKIESVDRSRSGRGANQAFVLQCVTTVCCRVNLVNQLPTLKRLHLFSCRWNGSKYGKKNQQKINNTFRTAIRPQKMPDVVYFNGIHFYTVVCMYGSLIHKGNI